MPARQLLAVVDDDESIRESLPPLLQSYGFEVRSFASAEEFLAANGLRHIQCVILDVAMPGMSGPQMQQEIIRRGLNLPVVFITAHSFSEISPEAMRRGAIAVLAKPFSEDAILGAVRKALSAA